MRKKIFEQKNGKVRNESHDQIEGQNYNKNS